MSKPAAKRLLDIIKRRRLKNKLTKFLPTVGKFGTLKRWVVDLLTATVENKYSRSVTGGAEGSSGGMYATSQAVGAALQTCLIQVQKFTYWDV